MFSLYTLLLKKLSDIEQYSVEMKLRSKATISKTRKPPHRYRNRVTFYSCESPNKLMNPYHISLLLSVN